MFPMGSMVVVQLRDLTVEMNQSRAALSAEERESRVRPVWVWWGP